MGLPERGLSQGRGLSQCDQGQRLPWAWTPVGSLCRCCAPGWAVRGAGWAAGCTRRLEEGRWGLSVSPGPRSALCVRASRLGCVTPCWRDKVALDIFLLSPHFRALKATGMFPSPQGRRKDCGCFVQAAELAAPAAPGPAGSPLSAWLRARVAGLVVQACTRTHARTFTRAHTRSAPIPHPLLPGPEPPARPRSPGPGLGPSTSSTVCVPGAGGLFPRSGAGLGTCRPARHLLTSSGPRKSPQMPRALQQWTGGVS